MSENQTLLVGNLLHYIIESEICSDLNQSHPELCTSLQTLRCFLESKSLIITHHHPEFQLQIVNIDNELATDNIIILTKYIHDILLTAITPHNEQDLFQWYDNNKRQLQSQFSGAHNIDTKRNARTCLEKQCHHWRMEDAQLQIEATRIENRKDQQRQPGVQRHAQKAPVNSPRNNPDHYAGDSAAQFKMHSMLDMNNNNQATYTKHNSLRNRLN